MLKKIIFPIALILLGHLSSIAQTDSLNVKNDSINAAKLKGYSIRIAEIESQRIEDSAKKIALEERLSALKTTDNLKKEELQKQLLELNDKEKNRIAQKKAQIDSLRSTVKGFPVIGCFNDTLFFIYSKQGSFSAKEIANAISGRIDKLKNNFEINADSFIVVESETTMDIMVGENIIMSVSENEALWNNQSNIDLANNYKLKIEASIKKYKDETSLLTIGKEIGMAFGVLIIIGILIYYTNKLFKWITQSIKNQEGKSLKGINIKTYSLFDASQQVSFIQFIINIFKWLLLSLILYISLPILFGIFPWTRNFADTLFGYVLNPLKNISLGLWNYLPKLITVIVIVFVFRYVIRGIKFLKNEIEIENLKLPGFYSDWANPTFQIVKVLLYAFMFILIFPYLPGSDSPIFQGVSVFLGFLFTFGSAGSLSNVIAGLVLTYMRLFKIGDRVKIGEVVGDVIEKSLLVTRIRTIKNEIISIPNSTVMSSHTINYSSDAPEKGLIMHTTVTIGYDVPWKKMHQILIDSALRTDMLLKDPKPFVLQTSLDDFYVSYQLNAYTKEPNKQALIYSELHQNIQDVCNENGVEILSPHYRAARDGNMVTIPADYLPKDYKAPSFSVEIKNKVD